MDEKEMSHVIDDVRNKLRAMQTELELLDGLLANVEDALE